MNKKIITLCFLLVSSSTFTFWHRKRRPQNGINTLIQKAKNDLFSMKAEYQNMDPEMLKEVFKANALERVYAKLLHGLYKTPQINYLALLETFKEKRINPLTPNQCFDNIRSRQKRTVANKIADTIANRIPDNSEDVKRRLKALFKDKLIAPLNSTLRKLAESEDPYISYFYKKLLQRR